MMAFAWRRLIHEYMFFMFPCIVLTGVTRMLVYTSDTVYFTTDRTSRTVSIALGRNEH